MGNKSGKSNFINDLLQRKKPKNEGYCLICLENCDFNVCVKCEAEHDAVLVYLNIYVYIQQSEILINSLKDKNFSIEKKEEINKKIKDFEKLIEYIIKRTKKYSICDLKYYNQNEIEIYNKYFDEEFNKLSNNESYRNIILFWDDNGEKKIIQSGYIYDSMKYCRSIKGAD